MIQLIIYRISNINIYLSSIKKYTLLLILGISLNNTQYLIYTDLNFQNAAISISNLHSNEVPIEMQLNTEIIYKENLDSQNISINDYIENEISNNSSLKYLLLIGDEYIIEPQYFYGTATDDLFSKTMINNYPIPQLITGRIIASSNQEAEFQIEKIRNYILNSDYSAWKSELLLLADDEFQNNNSIREEKYHTYFSNKIFNELSNYIPVTNLFGVDYPKTQTSDWYLQPELTQKIINTINSGVGIINYIGHGTHEILSTENMLSFSRDLDLINTNNKPPIWIVGTCSFGDYINKDCFAEKLLSSDDAAISIISTTNGISPESNWHYLKNFFNVHLKNYILNNTNERLGDLFLKSKQSALDLALSNQYPHNIYSGYRFNIFGDPALPISVSKFENLSNIDTIYIGSENQLQLNNNFYSTLKIFDKNEVDYKVYNYNLGENDYNPALPDSCLQFSNFINPITNQTYSCNDTLIFESNGAKLYQGNFYNTINYYIPMEVDNNSSLKSYIYNEQSNYSSSIQCINQIPIIISNDPTLMTDIEGPEIKIFFNDNELTNQSSIYSPYNFNITLSDELPINLSGLNFHDIRLWIDNNQSNSLILNDYFISNENSDTSGYINILIADSLLQNDSHTINIESWDIINNQSITSILLNNNMIDENVYNVYNFPNPFSNKTYFTFNLKRAEQINIELTIYNKNGVKIISFNEFIENIKNFHTFPQNGWNGRNQQNEMIGNGTYFYNLKIKNSNNHLLFDKVRTITIIK